MLAVVGDDGLARCPWGAREGVLREYHDTEWGVPVLGEQAYFERLCLEGFQSGLSWLTILNKRSAFREVFANFEVDLVAGMDDSELEQVLLDPRIVRNRAKVFATRDNARAAVELRSQGGLPDLIDSHRPQTPPAPIDSEEVPTTSAESVALSKALKKASFRFVGPTTAHALMEAIGLIDTHLVDCHRRGVGCR